VGAGEVGVKNLNDKLGSLGSVLNSASAASDGGDISSLLVLPLLVSLVVCFQNEMFS
jgi:hypothetical protein